MVVTGEWTSAAERIVAGGKVDRLWLNYARGYAQPDLSFLAPWPLRSLNLIDRSVTDLRPLARLGGTLEDLSVEAAPGATLDLAGFPRLASLGAMWDAVGRSISNASGLRAFVAVHYGERDLWPLSDNRELRRLVLKSCDRLETLAGLPVLDQLEDLSVLSGRRLRSIEAVEAMPSLRELSVEDCRSLSTIEPVGGLTSLGFLSVSNCGNIESLAPLAALEQLETFYAWGSTRVLDDDLRPLAGLPRLSEIRMRDRTSYDPRVRSLPAAAV